jgi:hypothetical protein
MPQVVMAVAAVVGAVTAVKSAKAQNKAAESAQKQQELSYARSQKQAIREAQIRRAQATASVQSMGTISSSGFSGGVSSINAQLGSTLGYSGQLSGLAKEQSMYQSRAATLGAYSNLAFATSDFASKFAKAAPTGV